MDEVPVAADAALAPLLAAPCTTARVVVATPSAAYAVLPALAGDAGPPAVVGLLTPDAVRVPGSVVAPAALVRSLRAGDGWVSVGDGAVTVGAARLVVRRWWDATVPPLRALRLPPPEAGAAAVPDAVRRGARLLAAALAGDGDTAGAVAGLVGLGPGLTPAGDDVLAAVLVTLVAGGDPAGAGALRDAVRPRLAGTTTVSAALLAHAGAGRAVPQLARHLRLPTDAAALADLLRVGSSSGAALALGARVGLGRLVSGAAATMASTPAREVA